MYLGNMFAQHNCNDAQVEDMNFIRQRAEAFAEAVNITLNGPEADRAIARVQEAMLIANSAIERGE